MMRRWIASVLAIPLFLSAAAATADESHWTPLRGIVQGYRNVTSLVESSLALVNTFRPAAGTSAHITSGLEAADFDELALRLSSDGGAYTYLLEVWTKRGDTWSKAMEYAYDNAAAGQIVVSPYAFDSASYQPGSLHKIVFAHSGSQRQMTVSSEHAVAVNNVTASIGLAQEEGDYVDLYFTAHLQVNLEGSPSNDAYLFGARIGKAAPHRCSAKQGVRDQGDPYDFTLYGASNPVNVGHFDESGFVEDGQSSDGAYPAAAAVEAASLPTAAAVNAVEVDFQSTADPDFI